MNRVDRMYKLLALAFILAVLFPRTGGARETVTMMVTGEDFTKESHLFNLSRNDYELVVTKDEYINWRRAANRFRYYQDMAAKGEAEPAMDLAFVDNNWLSALIQNGWLTDLSGLTTETKRFLPCLLDAAKQQDKVYALPFSTKGLVVFYRRDFHKAYGLSIPKSLDQLADNCRILMAKEHLDHGLTLHYSAIHLDVLPFIWSGGGDIMIQGKPSLNSAPVIDALNTFCELSKEGILPSRQTFMQLKKNYREALIQFINGRSAYLLSWNNRVSDLDKSALAGRYGVMPVPSLKRGQNRYSVIGSWYFAIPEVSSHKKGALAFLDFMYSDRMQTAMPSYHPGFLSAIQHAKGTVSHPMQKDLEQALSSMRLRLNHPMEQDISQVFENAVKQIVVEGRRAEEVLPVADHRIEALLRSQD